MRHLVSGSQGNCIPWYMVLPKSEFKAYFEGVVKGTAENFESLPFSYYETAWLAGNRVVNSLKPSMIDDDIYKKFSESNASSPGLESFRPKRSGYAHLPIYDRLSTRTGRFTVVDGPNILVLKKEMRSIIKPSHPEGKIAYLDFRALEARIVLAEAGRHSSKQDLYQDIADTLFKGVLPRDVVKVAVLAELYGVSRNALRIKLGVSEKKLDSFIGSIKEYFDVESLKSRLKSQLNELGKITNRFGRPLVVPQGQDNLLVNTFAQSTGVDVAMIGFDSIIKSLGSEGIKPLFVLHDAIILDVSPDRIKDVESCTEVLIPTYSTPFLLKFESIEHSAKD